MGPSPRASTSTHSPATELPMRLMSVAGAVSRHPRSTAATRPSAASMSTTTRADPGSKKSTTHLSRSIQAQDMNH